MEALNEEFYKIVAGQFYQLVGATEGKGAKAITYNSVLKLPFPNPGNNGAAKVYQEFAVRLIGRTIFCWFLKVKKSDAGISLLPEHLLSSEAVKKNKSYYHSILEKLFFQTLNTPINERVKYLPDGCEQIPFLNGGLFEPQTDDYYKANPTTGLSENINTLKIPDEWFQNFFEKLEQYNFTIDENSVVDIEVSVDPEMLGRIFENLLAEIDPDSGETARKATGSFYTPREIVDYMATESLVHYLTNQTKIDKESLHPIFKIDSEVSFNKNDSEIILEALDKLKILDPACGSGAFPMGVLQKMVMALQKLDKDATWWKARQINRIENVILKKQVKEKLQETTVEYARKIGIIQNSLYGVDIQPIAAEISKLRCFLSLIVDENIDETKSNRGVEPLPNLEFKFVTADTLLQLPKEQGVVQFAKSNQKNTVELERELHEIRMEYLQSTGEEKLLLKQQFKKVQKQIFDQQGIFGAIEHSRAHLISTWNPFSHDKADWFDPLWMFGVKDFDIVIGNPPYITVALGKKQKIFTDKQIETYKKDYSDVFEYKANVFAFFISRGKYLLKENGNLSFIVPNSLLLNSTFSKLRGILLKESNLLYLIDLRLKVFESAEIGGNLIIGFQTHSDLKIEINCMTIDKISSLQSNVPQKISSQEFLKNDEFKFNFKTEEAEFLSRLYLNATLLGDIVTMYQGIITGDNSKFLSKEKYNETYKPILRGRDIERYKYTFNENYILFDKEKLWSNTNEKLFFSTEKLINRQTGDSLVAAYDDKKFLSLDSTHIQVLKNNNFHLKYVLSLFNSKLINFWYKVNISETGRVFAQVKTIYLKKIPIKNLANSKQLQFVMLVDFVLLLNKLGEKNPINEYVPNSHIVQLFDTVIDALVYELYFEEDFKKAGIAFMKYAERDFKSIEGHSKEDKIKAIHEAYQTLREKNNEIRQNLKLMDTRLADLIMPIKTAK